MSLNIQIGFRALAVALIDNATQETWMSVDFFLDYRSPFSYLANTQIGKLGARIAYKPIDILAVMKLVNNQPSPACPPKARYAMTDAVRSAKHYKVPFSPNLKHFQALKEKRIDGALLSRIAIAAQELGMFDAVNNALFEALWAGTDDLVSEEGRKAFLERVGDTHGELSDLAASPRVKHQLDQLGEEAAKRGVFGVPTFFVGDDQFFGADRLSFVKESLAANKQTGEMA
jgi:2-hydroxychromene-2-carboxylate isomerase